MPNIDETELHDISGGAIRKLIDILAAHGDDDQLTTVMEELDEIQGKALQGRAVYIRVRPFTL
jgi:hypothetical protein